MEVCSDLNKADQQLKKPTTSLVVKSRKEYNQNFKSIISQNLKIKTKLGNKNTIAEYLVKLVINSCELKKIDPAIFDLVNLTHLDLSQNKLTEIDNFCLNELEELNLSQNEISLIGKNIKLPKLVSLDFSNNKLVTITKSFCLCFKSVSILKLNNNLITSFYTNFGYFFVCLKNFYASNNKLINLPFSVSHLRLEMLELNDNPFEFSPVQNNMNNNTVTFPSLVELCARQVVNKK